jgi:hypothetical protein
MSTLWRAALLSTQAIIRHRSLDHCQEAEPVLLLAHCAGAGNLSQHVASKCFQGRVQRMQQHSQQGECVLRLECLAVRGSPHTQVNLPCFASQARVTAFFRAHSPTTRLVQPAGEHGLSNGGVGCLPRTRNSAACCMFGCSQRSDLESQFCRKPCKAVARQPVRAAHKQQECG